MGILAGRRGIDGVGARSPSEVSPILLRAAAEVEEIVLAARHAVEGIEREAESLADPTSSAVANGNEQLIVSVTRVVGERAERLRVDAEELARILKRAAVQLNRFEAPGPDPSR